MIQKWTQTLTAFLLGFLCRKERRQKHFIGCFTLFGRQPNQSQHGIRFGERICR